MEQQHNLSYLSVCHSCLRRESGIIKSRRSRTLGQLLVCALALTICMFKVAAAETLCGGELVDALQFVCEDRGFYFSRPISRSNSRRVQNRGIVEECCFRSCDLALLEQYCAKPAKSERDVSATSLQVPVNPVIKTDVPRKHVTVKYSKYGLWQQNAAQRLRRGVPSVLLSKKFRRHTEKNKAREQKNAHKRLITPPTKLPPVWHSTETYISRN